MLDSAALAADGVEGTRGRRSLTVLIAAPAGNGGVAPHPAGVVTPGADGVEGTRGRRGPAIPIAAPAGDGAAAPHLAGVERPGADRDEGGRGRRGLRGRSGTREVEIYYAKKLAYVNAAGKVIIDGRKELADINRPVAVGVVQGD